MGYGSLAALCLVMTLADAEALLAIQFLPVPVIDVMAGLRLTESESMLRGLALLVAFFGTCSLVVWIIGASIVAFASEPHWQGLPWKETSYNGRRRTMVVIACASLLFWFFVLPFTQPEQILRRKVERDLHEGRIEKALATMSGHEPADFPPQWEPPPNWGYIGQVPPLFDVLDVMVDNPPAPWVRSAFISKFERVLSREFPPFQTEDFRRIAKLLKRLPEGQRIANLALGDEGWKAKVKKYYLEEPDPTEKDEAKK